MRVEIRIRIGFDIFFKVQMQQYSMNINFWGWPFPSLLDTLYKLCTLENVCHSLSFFVNIKLFNASKLLKYKFKCDEIPIKYFPRKYDEGKKINKIDGIKSLLVIIYLFFKS